MSEHDRVYDTGEEVARITKAEVENRQLLVLGYCNVARRVKKSAVSDRLRVVVTDGVVFQFLGEAGSE